MRDDMLRYTTERYGNPMESNKVLSVRIDYGSFTPITIEFRSRTCSELDVVHWIDTQTSYESFDEFAAELAEELQWKPLTERSIQYIIDRVSGIFPSGFEYIYDIDDYLRARTLKCSPDDVTMIVEIV